MSKLAGEDLFVEQSVYPGLAASALVGSLIGEFTIHGRENYAADLVAIDTALTTTVSPILIGFLSQYLLKTSGPSTSKYGYKTTNLNDQGLAFIAELNGVETPAIENQLVIGAAFFASSLAAEYLIGERSMQQALLRALIKLFVLDVAHVSYLFYALSSIHA